MRINNIEHRIKYPAGIKMIQAIKKLQAEIDHHRHEEKSIQYIKTVKDEGMQKIKDDFWNENQEYINFLKAKINKFKTSYEKEITKDLAKRLYQVDSWRNEYAGYTDKELKQAAMKISEDAQRGVNFFHHAGKCDVVAAELRKRGFNADQKTLRENIKKHRLNKPWQHVQTGKEAVDELKSFQTLNRDQYLSLWEDSSGQVGYVISEIDEIII